MKHNKQKREIMKTSFLLRVMIIIFLIYQVPDTDINNISELIMKMPLIFLDEIKYPKKYKTSKRGKDK